MLIAVTSQDYFRTVTPHAGKTRRFILFEADPSGSIREIERLELPEGMTFHDFAGGPHPLDRADVILTGSAGPGFVRKLATRGVAVRLSRQHEPIEAVRDYLATGAIDPSGKECADCGDHGHPHDHGHHHAHDHSHNHGHHPLPVQESST